ncbi:MAG: Uma2 family endonuclease [Aphanocapsa lilacina HA4352-LM1]|jgi:Uma2 family endonuclease|nr:Uma2 family endonuclease [Aphanocapsa lilacina HA4352-LM1]
MTPSPTAADYEGDLPNGNSKGHPELEENANPQVADAQSAALKVVSRLQQKLLNWVEPMGLGLVLGSEALRKLGASDLQVPDLAFFARERLRSKPYRVFPLVPDLVVRVATAPGQRELLERQILRWLERGAQVGLLVENWGATISVFRKGQVITLGFGQVLSLPEVLPGWEMQLAAL